MVYAFLLYKGAVGVASLLEVVAARLQGLPIQHALIILHRDMLCKGSCLQAGGVAAVLPRVNRSDTAGVREKDASIDNRAEAICGVMGSQSDFAAVSIGKASTCIEIC